MPATVKIGSNNYSGQTAVITFLPDTGGTVNVGSQVIPYDYSTDYFYGTYELDFTDLKGKIPNESYKYSAYIFQA